MIDGANHLFDGKTQEVGDALEDLLSGFSVAMRDAVIVSAVRTAVGKAPNGTLRHTRPDELAATVIARSAARARRASIRRRSRT